MKRTLLAMTVATFALVGCGAAVAPEDSSPATTRAAFAGFHEVPVPEHLKPAARYSVAEIEWNVVDNIASLSYRLPIALVGRDVRVEFTGPFDPTTGSASLTGAFGSAECLAVGTHVFCHEVMRGLLPLNPDLDVVEELAADYPGPSTHRLDVTAHFASDAVGIAHIELAQPVSAGRHLR